MSHPLRLGIAGLGTVGGGVVDILHRQADLIAMRAGRPVQITAVSARNRAKDRGVWIFQVLLGKTTQYPLPIARTSMFWLN